MHADVPDKISTKAAAYDWQVAGLNFASAVDVENPLERAFARVTKESIDQSNEPGDQSLDGWWVRSQTDWGGGAGYKFMEPISEDPIPTTFDWSYGINVWSEGELKLHRKPRVAWRPAIGEGIAPEGADPMMVLYSGYVYISIGADVYRAPVSEFGGEPSMTAYASFDSNVTQLLVGGGYLLAFTISDGVYRVMPDGNSVKLFTSSQGPVTGWHVKDRLILASSRSLYEQPIPDVTPVELSGETPIVTNPDPGWQWLAVTDAPGSILAAGRGTSTSTISAITIEANGGLPTLAAPIVVAELPRGEDIRSIESYLGAYLMISTSLGVRVGIIDTDDRIVYGPLIGPQISGHFYSYDRFAFASVLNAGEGRPGLIRLDLSNVTSENKVPWAYDVRTDAGYLITGIGLASPSLVIMCTMNSTSRQVTLYSVSTTDDVENYGVIQSGWIRMGSTVHKNWSQLGLVAEPPMHGQVKAYLITPTGDHEVGSLENPEYEKDFRFAESELHSSLAAVRLVFSKGGVTPPDEIIPPEPPEPIPTPDPGPEPGDGEQSWNTLRTFTWLEVKDSYSQWLDIADTSGGGGLRVGIALSDIDEKHDPTKTPVLESWILKATPAIERIELMRIPLSCFDWELDSRGQKIGGQGTALLRYEELAARVGTGKVVSMKNINTKRNFSVVVDDLSFRQSAPGSRGSGFGGVIDLVARVLT